MNAAKPFCRPPKLPGDQMSSIETSPRHFSPNGLNT